MKILYWRYSESHKNTFAWCRIFGHEGDAAEDIKYINWLNMVRAGVLGLEFYTPETQSWRQVSSQGKGEGWSGWGGVARGGIRR